MQSNFLDYYGMTLDPFSGDAGQVFCAVAGRAELLEQTLQMAEFAEMVPVVTGPSKAGKSTLLRQLFNQLKLEHQVVMLPGKRFAEQPASIDNWLADAFGLSGYAHAGRALLGYFNDQEQAPILLVDDAYALDEVSIALLTKFRQNGLRLVMTRHQDKALPKSVLPLYELALDPLDLQDTTRYLSEYFRAAGVPEGVPVDNKALAKIVQASGGWPGQLNALVRQHLIKNVGNTPAARSIPWPHLTAGVAVLALVIVSFLWQFNQVEPEDVAIELASGLETTAVPATESAGELDGELAGELAGEIYSNLASEQLPTSVPTMSVRARLQAAAAELEAAKAAPLPSEAEQATPMTQALDSKVETASSEPETRALESTTSAEPAAEEPSPVETTNLVAEAAPEPAPVAEPVQVAQSVTPAAYRLQFFGSWERSSANQFLQQQASNIDLYVAQTERDGKAWYVVLSDQGYADRQRALAAIEELPNGLKQLQPWARRQ